MPNSKSLSFIYLFSYIGSKKNVCLYSHTWLLLNNININILKIHKIITISKFSWSFLSCLCYVDKIMLWRQK